MKKNCLVSICLLIFSVSLSAINVFENREFIVVLQEENIEYIEKLTKSNKIDEIAQYKNNIKEYNENITKAFKDEWKESSVEFLLTSAVEAYTLDQLANSLVLNSERVELEKVNFLMFNIAEGPFLSDKKKKTINPTKNYLFKISLENDVPSYADFILLISKIKIYFNFQKPFDRNKLESMLASKKLIIDKAVDLSKEDVKSSYPFPFEFKTTEEILKLKNERDDNSIYVKLDVANGSDGLVNFLLIESKTGLILARCHITGLVKVSYNSPSEKHQKNYNSGSNCSYCPPPCLYCNQNGKEIFRLYTAKAKLKKTQLVYMSSTKKQLKWFPSLMIY